MKTETRIKKIVAWIKTYATKNKMGSLIVGISGGIDSSVVSTLCAMTGIPTIVVTLPIKQRKDLHSLSLRHAEWITAKFPNVTHMNVELTPTFKQFEKLFDVLNPLALANSRSRLRMMALYQIAQMGNGLVVGTGNKVEDFGVGFFTKYGDGGVDISPIADCMKTEVWDIGRTLDLLQDIIDATPTDGLWDDGRTDEQQLGVSYAELETAMVMADDPTYVPTKEQKKALMTYKKFHKQNLHKMNPIPVCKL
jgi:NAD+ synthase